MKKHMKVKELIAAAHSTANDLQPEASTLLREVAIRLDVTFAALTESLEIRRILEAEVEGKNSKPIPVTQQLPESGNHVLLYDQNGEGWVIGWRSVWCTFGQKETGEWDWSFQMTELNSENTNITHWEPIPDKPEMETL